jgi:hypothetical protein
MKVKPGLKTTEFWLTVVAGLLAALREHVLLELPTEAIYAVIAYVLGRSIIKAPGWRGGGPEAP